jgi:hypothetical protein
MRARSLPLLLLLACATTAAANPTLGFIEKFTAAGISTWGGGATYSNPGAGGVDNDGYLKLARSGFAGQLATHSDGLEYHGNWLAAHVNKINLFLNDVDTNQNLEVHVCIGSASNFWLYKPGFTPPDGQWARFSVDLTDSTKFQQIINLDGGGFAAAIQNVDHLHVRNDTSPYVQSADNVLGDFGVDNIELTSSLIGVDPLPAGAVRPIELSAPYPNPSRGALACAFDVFDAAPVRVQVIDAAGRIVHAETLAGAAPGRRTWAWNGLDAAGRAAPAGVYRVRVTGQAGGMSRPFVRVD